MCLSFHPRKTITTGEGGVIATDDDELAERMRALRNHGMDPNATSWSRFSIAGFNYRMSDMSAAIGLVQLDRLEFIVSERRRITALYREALAPLEGVRWPQGYDLADLSCQSMVVELSADVDRDAVMAHLADEGVQTTIGGYALSEQPYYRDRYGLRTEDVPNASRFAQSCLTLPVTVEMTPEDVEEVVSALRRAMESR